MRTSTGTGGAAMKTVLIVALLLWALPVRAQTAVDLESVPTAVATTGASVSGALAAPSITAQAGDDPVICVADASGTLSPTVTDTGTCNGGAPVRLQHNLSATTPVLDLDIWHCPNASSGAHVFTSTAGTGTQNQTLHVIDLRGVTASPADVGGTSRHTANSTSITGPSSLSGNPTQPAEIWVECGATAVSEASFTAISQKAAVQQKNTFGAAPSLFSLTITQGDPFILSAGIATFMPNWTGMATSTTSLSAVQTFIGGFQTSIIPLTNNVLGADLSGQASPISAPEASTSTGDCNRIQIMDFTDVMVNPTCTAAGCTCTRELFNNTYNSGAGSEAIFLCPGCANGGSLSCNLGIASVGTGILNVDAYTQSSTCLVDGTPNQNTGTATTITSNTLAGVKQGDVLLYDWTCNNSSGNQQEIVNESPMVDQATSQIPSGFTAENGATSFYIATAPSTVTAPVQSLTAINSATNPWIRNVIALSNTTATPSATPTPNGCRSVTMGKRGSGLHSCSNGF